MLSSPPRIRVLLVDDHPIVRIGLTALLAAEPDMVVVGEAGNGTQAVELVPRLRPDVVVMDISMPEMDGLEATRRIRACCSSYTSVLILTVHAQERYLFPVLKAGASGYVLKSTVDQELVGAIRAVAQGGAFLYPSATRLVLEDYLSQLQGGENSGQLRAAQRPRARGAQAGRPRPHRARDRRSADPQPEERRDLPHACDAEAQPAHARRPGQICPRPRAADRKLAPPPGFRPPTRGPRRLCRVNPARLV